MQAGDLQLQGSGLAVLAQAALHVLRRTADDLLDAGRVNAAIRQELLEGQAPNLAADGVEGAEDHRLGRIVDDDVDIHDEECMWSIIAARLQPRRDIVLADGPRDAWDPSGGLSGSGQYVGFDATRKWQEEEAGHAASPLIEMDPQITRQVTERWDELTSH